MLLALVPAAVAAATDTGAPFGPTDTDTDGPIVPTDTDDNPTDAGTPIDTAVPPPCPECMSAAELAGDEGGSPCSSGTDAGVMLLFLPALLIARARVGR